VNNQEKKQAISPAVKKLQEYRNTVLELYNFTDLQITAIISQYYMGELDEKFVSNVLYASSMTSSGRIGILREILKETGLYNKKLIENLENMAKIRNYFAHGSYIFSLLGAVIGIAYGVKVETKDISIFNPKHLSKPEEKFDCEKEYNKFTIYAKNAGEALNDILGKITKLSPNKKTK